VCDRAWRFIDSGKIRKKSEKFFEEEEGRGRIFTTNLTNAANGRKERRFLAKMQRSQRAQRKRRNLPRTTLPGALLRLKPSRIKNLIDFYLAPRLATIF